MMQRAVLAGLMLTGLMTGCKPPPSDAAVARVSLLSSLASGPSEPLASPDTARAIWANTANPLRLVYGVPGQPVLLALECRDAATPQARLRITRHAPADGGAQALLALIGNGAIGRVEVDAVANGSRSQWQGERSAQDPAWEPLAGPREFTVTVPGAGLVRVNPGDQPMQLLTACRAAAKPPAPELSPLR